MLVSPGVGQHQLDAVFLIDAGGTGIIVDGNDVGGGVIVLNFTEHPLSDNVIGETAKGLSADDVGGAGVD